MDVNLILFKTNGSQKVFPLPSSITVVGRRHDCDLRIPLKSVSRRHCQLSLNKETLKIRDLGSRNGTYLNGKRITEEAAIQPGDYIKIGPLTFALQIDGQPENIVPPELTAEKSPMQAKPAVKAAAEAEKESDSFLELATVDEKADELPELNLDEDDDFLAELEDI